MLDFMEFFRNSFFSGAVCCGLAILRGVKIKSLPTVYFCGFVCAGVFLVLNSLSLPFIGAFTAAATVCVLVGIFENRKSKNHLYIIIPSIYCITPGGAMYKLFSAFLSSDWSAFHRQFDYTINVAVGCWLAIIFASEIKNMILKNNS